MCVYVCKCYLVGYWKPYTRTGDLFSWGGGGGHTFLPVLPELHRESMPESPPALQISLRGGGGGGVHSCTFLWLVDSSISLLGAQCHPARRPLRLIRLCWEQNLQQHNIWLHYFIKVVRYREQKKSTLWGIQERTTMYMYLQCKCVCVRGGGGGAGTNRHLGAILCFNRISVDTRAVGTSPVVKPMPINVLSIFKHIDIVNVIDTVGKSQVCKGVSVLGGLKITFCVYCIRNGPRLMD